MGEHVISSLTLLTVTVPVDTQGPTVRPEVHTSTVGLCVHVCSIWPGNYNACSSSY